ncbi:L-serine ammonia-lyase, iron-sulfur-dependent, subunit alpha [Paratractidigestivibacter sp.]|uniref:L-serine ammonia-lyase, iron-sulfur-dependent, subunit alpha n=1 Tax=Paratractidigestivibacter sp. TaxID=2847316 RepID=UPI002AC99D74|nr:L-serine ammonia-lyase, iron-sulfur-dependent, subunit alpha [Paratractidigestivibacter sp.]
MASKPQTLATTSAFEVLGPIMVGPSSSHTAGALRCAQVAASLVDGRVASVRFSLWNSFAHTHKGHGTDRALVAGILGLSTYDERIRDAFALAAEAGLDYGFVAAGDDATMHPNTVDIQMKSDSGTVTTVRGESLGGGKVRISRINGVGVDVTGRYTTLFVAHRDVPGVLAALANLLAYAQVNIAFCRTYRTEEGGQAYTVFETDVAPAESVLDMARGLEHVDFATFISLSGAGAVVGPGVSAEELFDDGEQMLGACAELGLSIGGVMRTREEMLIGKDAAASVMKRVIETMRDETTAPIEHPTRSLGGFIGGEATAVKTNAPQLAAALMGDVQTDAVARAMAVLERSAAMGVIVAAPTAGSAGVVPGCVLALADHLGADDDAVAEALYCAAAIGLNIQTGACVAGAEGGCQAEVGSAAAMAAAACAQLMGATPEQALTASSLTISNLLGLVCDPVGGLVEVPCQVRNAIGVAAAFSSAQLALSGVRSLVPFDQVVHAMSEVGHALPASLRETARGGLAATPAACAACGARN